MAHKTTEPISTGTRFGRLTVIANIGLREMNGGRRRSFVRCRCDCGNVVEAPVNQLKRGIKRSCGCLFKEMLVNRNTTHGGTHTRLYKEFRGMWTRCYDSNSKSYCRYGALGVRICAEWLESFDAFREWSMSHGYADNLTIDRIDSKGNYEPSNCRWIPANEQARNRRSCRYFTIDGNRMCLAEACRYLGLNYATIYDRITRSRRRGVSISDEELFSKSNQFLSNKRATRQTPTKLGRKAKGTKR